MPEIEFLLLMKLNPKRIYMLGDQILPRKILLSSKFLDTNYNRSIFERFIDASSKYESMNC